MGFGIIFLLGSKTSFFDLFKGIRWLDSPETGIPFLIVMIGFLGTMAFELTRGLFRLLGKIKTPEAPRKWLHITITHLTFIVWWPFRISFATAGGFLGFTHHRLHLEHALSPLGRHVFDRLPVRVSEGLDRPIGDFGDLAIHYVVHRFPDTSNMQWARRLIARVRDVSVIISAAIIALVIALATDAFNQYMKPQQPQVSAARTATLANEALSSSMAQVLRRLVEFRPPTGWADTEWANDDRDFRRYTSVCGLDPSSVRYRYGYFYPSQGCSERGRSVLLALTTALNEKLSRTRDGGFAKDLRESLETAFQNLGAKIQADAEAAAIQGQQFFRHVLQLLAVQLVLFLYLIFFLNLRGVIQSMVEALAIEEQDRIASRQPAAIVELAPEVSSVGVGSRELAAS